jgi:tRNA G18 (ribose-2'-O)-methylase SpoU
MRDRQRTKPDLSLQSSAHQTAMADPDHFRLWERAVIDRFKDKSTEEIKAELKATAFPYAVAMENWTGDFNFSTMVRNANAFNAKEVFYIGDKKWDRRGAQGSYNYIDVQWISDIEQLVKLNDRYTFVGIDNVPGSVPIHSFIMPKNPLFIFGSEGTGLTSAIQELCQHMVQIPMFGSVRSINCGTASGIVMYEFVRRQTET